MNFIGLFKVDIQGGDILMLIVSSIVIYSVFIYSAVTIATRSQNQSPVGDYVGSTWLPALTIAEILGCVSSLGNTKSRKNAY